jgi:signal transduction histidine kinase
MVGNNASCGDIALAAAQCTANMIPGCNALVINVDQDAAQWAVIASSNAPFANRGESVPLLADSIVSNALLSPQRTHRGDVVEADRMFPTRHLFSMDDDNIILGKAISRNRADPMILTVITSDEFGDLAEAVLMTLSELLNALCTGQDATKLNEQNQVSIGIAKREWERTVDTLNDLVCLIDRDGKIVRANRTAERWRLGSVTEIRGLHIHELLHPLCKIADCALANAVSPVFVNRSSDEATDIIVSDERLDRILSIRRKNLLRMSDYGGRANEALIVVAITDVTDLHRTRDKLKSLNESLEKRVEDRTEELQSVNKDLNLEVERRRAAEDALEQSRVELETLSHQLINAQEDERARVSRELHDSIGQSLGAIKYMLERVSSADGRLTADEAAAGLASAIDAVTDTIGETRAISMRLRPPILDDMGAVAAMRYIVGRFSETYPDTDFHLEIAVTNDDVSPDLTTTLYRIIQEALNNVVKHAQAKSALVSLRQDAKTLTLEIVDDGVGFDSSGRNTGHYRRIGNFGRLGMRERALNSNGQLFIESSIGKGTKVTVEWDADATNGDKENEDE